MPAQYEQSPQSDERPPRRTGMWLVVVLAVILLVAAVIAGVAQRPASAPPPGQPPSTGQQPQSLPSGDVRVGASEDGDSVWGVPIGYSAGRAGGIAAAVNWTVYHTHESQLVESQRTAVQDAIYAPTYEGKRITAEQASQMRAQTGLNEAGQIMLASGQVDLTSRAVMHCDGAVGAYRVQQATDQGATVEVWMPCMFGVSTNNTTQGLQLVWTKATGEVAWNGQQWQLTDFQPAEAPQPANPSEVTPPERARLLDSAKGWVVPANSTNAVVLEKR